MSGEVKDTKSSVLKVGDTVTITGEVKELREGDLVFLKVGDLFLCIQSSAVVKFEAPKPADPVKPAEPKK